MLTGALVAESLRVGTTLEGIDLAMRRILRVQVSHATTDQPDVWTLIEFTADSERAPDLARILAAALDTPGWYASFETEPDGHVFVIFRGKVFRYTRDDETAHANAVAYALAAGVPESQCDW